MSSGKLCDEASSDKLLLWPPGRQRHRHRSCYNCNLQPLRNFPGDIELSAQAARNAEENLIPETILLLIVFGLYWFVGERIDERLNTVHKREVDRVIGIDPETTDDPSRPYWLEFWLKQSTRQLNDPTLNRLVQIAFAAIAAFFGILGYILFGGAT